MNLSELSRSVTGPVLTPADEGYAAETATYILGHPQQPAVAVGATSAADVRAAVRFAAAHNLPVAVLATGHGAFVPADGGVLINVSRLDGISIDRDTRIARVGAGVRWQAAQLAAAEHGLAGIAGSSPTVGVVGYTLGGGLSPTLGRAYGFAADHVVAAEIVTADGELRRVDAGHEPELFWALRGGKGNFGVVTALEFELVPHARLWGGGLFYSADHVRPVVDAYRRVVAEAPEDLTLSFAFLRMPDLPFVPELLRGRFTLQVRVAYLGSAEDGGRLVRPLRDAAPRVLEVLTDMPFPAAVMIHNDPTDPLPAVERSLLLTDLADEAVDALLAVTGPEQPFPAVMVEVRHLGGALGRDPKEPNAVGHRDARFNLFAAALGGPELEAPLDGLAQAMGPWATGGTLVNFLSAGDARDRVPAAYEPAAWVRLTRAKSTYDPANLFRVNFNIPPVVAAPAVRASETAGE